MLSFQDVDDFTRLFNAIQDVDLLKEVAYLYNKHYGTDYDTSTICHSTVAYQMCNLGYELCVSIFFKDHDDSFLDLPLRYLSSEEEIEADAQIVKDLRERQQRALKRLQSL